MLTDNRHTVCPGVRRLGGWRLRVGQRAAAAVGRGPLTRSVALAAGAALLAGAAWGSGAVWVEREAHVMGTRLQARVAVGEATRGIAAIEAAFDAVRRADRLLSTWRDDSEIHRLNAAPPGRPVALPPALLGLLAETDRWRRVTRGAFDPGVGPLVDAWDLRGAGRVPQPAELNRALAAAGLAGFTLDTVAGTALRRRAGSWVDTGGFGKGAALREARAALLAHGARTAVLNFGGQVLALGAGERGQGWRVPVAHPARRGEPAALLVLRDRSAATTSQSERFVVVGDATFGHVLDPRNGRPVAPWGSVTVVAADPLVADVLATALFVMGPERGLDWLAGHDDVAALFLIRRGDALERRWSAPMEAYLASGSVRHGRQSS